MTGEERGQYFILEIFLDAAQEGIKAKNASEQVSDKMAEHQAIKLIIDLSHSGSLTEFLPVGSLRSISKPEQFYKITPIGITYYNYLKNEWEKDILQERKLRIDVKNAERIFKTYWITFGMALLGLAISIYLLILKLKGL